MVLSHMMVSIKGFINANINGKDPCKEDRSGAYIIRYVDKHIIAAGLAGRCTTQVSCAIGMAEPTSLYVNLHRTGKVSEMYLTASIKDLFAFRPMAIMEILNLKQPVYRKTAVYGYFFRNGFAWEE